MCESRCGVEWYGGDSEDDNLFAEYECPHCNQIVEQGSELRLVYPPRPTLECSDCGSINFSNFPMEVKIQKEVS